MVSQVRCCLLGPLDNYCADTYSSIFIFVNVAVGYGNDEETQEPYFLVKNSWGAKWGLDGYVKFSRNSKNDFGMCAILKMASFPEVE